jgi:hypothetical protein
MAHSDEDIDLAGTAYETCLRGMRDEGLFE